MSYIIKTISKNSTHTHIIEDLGMNEIQEIFSPDSILPYSPDLKQGEFDLHAKMEYNGNSFQIISDYTKIIDFYEWLRLIKPKSASAIFSILSVNSITHPLDEVNMKKLLSQLEEKYIIKKQTITPQLLALVESMYRDTQDFITRFNGYAEPSELDLIQSWSSDLQVFVQQGHIDDAKKRMNQLIEKMELIENTYIKKINIDEDKPLEEFNHELNSIMNQNRLSRYQGLNQLSGGSSFDYYIYKLRSRIKSWFTGRNKNTLELTDIFGKIVHHLSGVLLYGCILALVIMFFYQRLINPQQHFDYILWGTIGLTILFINRFSDKKNLVLLISTLLFGSVGYLIYSTLTINFGL